MEALASYREVREALKEDLQRILSAWERKRKWQGQAEGAH